MKAFRTIAISFFLLIWAGLYGEEDYSEPFKVFLTMDRLTVSSEEPVILRISVKNESSANAEFFVYDNDRGSSTYTTFQPRVFDMDGRELENIIDYRERQKLSVEEVENLSRRSVILGPGEIFTCTEDLRDIYRIPAGTFRVRCYFVPDFRVRHVVHGDNELTFFSRTGSSSSEQKVLQYTDRRISPSETVLLTLEAEKSSDRERMLKYIDLEEFIKTESGYILAYTRAAGQERKEVLAKFRTYLIRDRKDYLIDYKIVEEEISGDTAYVDVLAERYNTVVSEKYRYRYILKRDKGPGKNWLITGLEASVHKGRI